MISLGPEFEEAIVKAAGLDALNVEPGSLQIDTIGDPITTVRVTVVGSVSSDVLRAAGSAALAPVPAATEA